jgi:hypothetical protein
MVAITAGSRAALNVSCAALAAQDDVSQRNGSARGYFSTAISPVISGWNLQ